jgi:hypothetical protein
LVHLPSFIHSLRDDAFGIRCTNRATPAGGVARIQCSGWPSAAVLAVKESPAIFGPCAAAEGRSLARHEHDFYGAKQENLPLELTSIEMTCCDKGTLIPRVFSSSLLLFSLDLEFLTRYPKFGRHLRSHQRETRSSAWQPNYKTRSPCIILRHHHQRRVFLQIRARHRDRGKRK